MRNTYRLFLVLSVCFLITSALGQTLNSFPTYVDTDLKLEPGVYKVEGVCYVKPEATLFINSEVTLLFNKDATIRVEGGLEIQGQKHSLVNVFSLNPREPGNGFVITGVSSSKLVSVDFVRFKYIKKPLSFEFRWSRKQVDITNSVIKHSNYEGASIEVKELDNLLTEKKVIFNISNNTFSNNSSSILFSNITTDLLTINYNQNVVTRNTYSGQTRNGIFTSPLYMTYNMYEANDAPYFKGNSIFNNYYCLYYEDTFNIGRTNISVIGSASSLDLNDNYFGDPKNKEIEETVDYIAVNYRAPFLVVNQVLEKPSDKVNGHFYSVLIDGEEMDESLRFIAYKNSIKNIKLQFNRSVIEGIDFGVYYHYEEADSVRSVILNYGKKWSDINKMLELTIDDKIRKYGDNGYLEITGLYDGNGIDVPSLQIGKTAIIDPKLSQYIPVNFQRDTEENGENEIKVPNPKADVIFDPELLNDSFIHRKKEYWDVGFFMGNAVYFGDLNITAVSANPRNMKPASGIRFGYQIAEKFRIGIMGNYLLISGSDQAINPRNPNVRGTNFDRGLSFRTTIIDGGLTVDYNLTRFTTRKTFVPYLHGGVNYYYFKPMGQVNGEGDWYDLRSIGTEGQTLDGQQNQYEKALWGIPCGIGVKRHLSERAIVQFSYTYNRVFTDYLDDVSTGYYPDPEALKTANPDLGETAVRLANPNGSTGQRSSSDKHDGYGYWGFTFSYKL